MVWGKMEIIRKNGSIYIMTDCMKKKQSRTGTKQLANCQDELLPGKKYQVIQLFFTAVEKIHAELMTAE